MENYKVEASYEALKFDLIINPEIDPDNDELICKIFQLHKK